MVRRTIQSVLCAVLCVGLAGGMSHIHAADFLQSLTAGEKSAVDAFTQKTKKYISDTRALPGAKLKPTADVKQLEEQRVQLRTQIQQSRPNAKQGEFFSTEIAPVFRRLLAQTLAGPDGKKIRASLAHAEPGAPADFKVNEVFPNLKGQPMQSTPPSLLGNLPVLPKGLEYRVAGNTLAIRDSDANLVVDYLPNALQ